MTQDEQLLEQLMEVFVDRSWAEALPLILQTTAWASLSRTESLPVDLTLPRQMNLSPQEQADNFRCVQPLISSHLTSASWTVDATLLQHLPLLIEKVVMLEKQGLRKWCSDDVLYWSSEPPPATSAIAPSLANFLISLATFDAPDQIYLPWERSGQLAARCRRRNIDCWIESPAPLMVDLVLAQLSGAHPNAHRNDPVLSPVELGPGQLKQFPVSLSILEPAQRYSLKDIENDPHDRFPEKTHSNIVLSVRHLLAQTHGKIVVVVPNGLLFNAGAERLFRADLLQKRMIHTIIGLPDGLFPGSSTANSVLILDTAKPSDSIRFVKITEEFTESGSRKCTELANLPQLLRTTRDRDNNPMAINVAVSAIARDECNLELGRYLLDEQTRKLSAVLARQHNTKMFDHFEVVRARQHATSAKGVSVREIQAADLPDYGLVLGASKDSLFDLSTPKAQSYFIQRNDVLICLKGAVGRVGFVKSAPERGAGGWVAGQSLAILRARPSGQYDPRALMVYLRSPMGQAQLSRLAVGSSIPTLQGSALKELEIPTMNIVQQGMAVEALEEEASVQSEIEALRQKQSKIASALWKL
jgi:type I restriction enzyme M protein